MVLSEDLPQEQQQQAPRAGTALPLQVYLRLFGRGMEEKNKKKPTKISLICGDALHNQTKASLFLLQTLR